MTAEVKQNILYFIIILSVNNTFLLLNLFICKLGLYGCIWEVAETEFEKSTRAWDYSCDSPLCFAGEKFQSLLCIFVRKIM